MEAYQVEARSAAQVLHDDPQLVSAQEAGLVLRDIAAGACAEHRDLLLDFLDIVFARLEIDLGGNAESARVQSLNGMQSCTYVLDCDRLPRRLVDALVHDAEAAACAEGQLAWFASKMHARMVATHGRAPPAPGSGLRHLRLPLLSLLSRSGDDETQAWPYNMMRSIDQRNGGDRWGQGAGGEPSEGGLVPRRGGRGGVVQLAMGSGVSWVPGFLAARRRPDRLITGVPGAIKITGRLKLASRVLWLLGCRDNGHGPLFTLDLDVSGELNTGFTALRCQS
jgi:hypothetical protein